MPSTYSTNLRVELQATGENSNTWGAKTNTSLQLLEQAIAGVASVAMTDADYTLTTANAATDEARNAVIIMTGTTTVSRNVIVPSVDKMYIVKNSTTGGFNIVVKTAAGTGVTVANGSTVAMYCDATNVASISAAAGANADITSMTALTAAAAAANPVRATDLQVQLVTAFTTGGTSTAFTLTPTPATTANVTGQRFYITFNAAAGATPTLAVSGQTAKNLKFRDYAGAKQAVTAAEIPSGWASDVEYDGTDWVVLHVANVQAYDADIPTVSASQAEMEAGTEAALRSMSPLRIAQAIAALAGGGITLGTPVASTSGTSIDFTGLPATIKELTVMFSGVSISGTSPLIIQLGDAGGFETTGYLSRAYIMSGTTGGNSTAGFILQPAGVAAAVLSGQFVLTLENPSAFRFIGSGALVDASGYDEVWKSVGEKATSAVLTQIRITTVGGSDTFDAGEINISYK